MNHIKTPKRSSPKKSTQQTKKTHKRPQQHSRPQTAKRTFSTAATPTKPAFQPNGSRILVQKDVAEKPKTNSGILLPSSSSKNQQLLATVVAVGPGLRNNDGKYVPTFCRVGDRVVLPEFGGLEIKLNDVVYNLYRDDDIPGIASEVDISTRCDHV